MRARADTKVKGQALTTSTWRSIIRWCLSLAARRHHLHERPQPQPSPHSRQRALLPVVQTGVGPGRTPPPTSIASSPPLPATRPPLRPAFDNPCDRGQVCIVGPSRVDRIRDSVHLDDADLDDVHSSPEGRNATTSPAARRIERLTGLRMHRYTPCTNRGPS